MEISSLLLGSTVNVQCSNTFKQSHYYGYSRTLPYNTCSFQKCESYLEKYFESHGSKDQDILLQCIQGFEVRLWDTGMAVFSICSE